MNFRISSTSFWPRPYKSLSVSALITYGSRLKVPFLTILTFSKLFVFTWANYELMWNYDFDTKVNILAKSSNFFPLWNQNMLISSVFFHTGTDETLMTYFKRREVPEIFHFSHKIRQNKVSDGAKRRKYYNVKHAIV